MEAFDITHNDQVIATILLKEEYNSVALFDYIVDNSMVDTQEKSIISPN